MSASAELRKQIHDTLEKLIKEKTVMNGKKITMTEGGARIGNSGAGTGTGGRKGKGKKKYEEDELEKELRKEKLDGDGIFSGGVHQNNKYMNVIEKLLNKMEKHGMDMGGVLEDIDGGEVVGTNNYPYGAGITGGKKRKTKKDKEMDEYEDEGEGLTGGEHDGDGLSGGKKRKRKTASGVNPWISHVKKYAKENGIPYREALKKAKSTYKG